MVIDWVWNYWRILGWTLYVLNRLKGQLQEEADPSYCAASAPAETTHHGQFSLSERRRWPQWVLEHPQCKAYDRKGQFCGAVAAWLEAAWHTPALVSWSRQRPSRSPWVMTMAASRVNTISRYNELMILWFRAIRLNYVIVFTATSPASPNLNVQVQWRRQSGHFESIHAHSIRRQPSELRVWVVGFS